MMEQNENHSYVGTMIREYEFDTRRHLGAALTTIPTGNLSWEQMSLDLATPFLCPSRNDFSERK